MGNSVLLQTVCGTSPSEIRRVSTLLSSAHLSLLYFAKRGSKVEHSDLEHRRMARLSADQRCFNFTSFDANPSLRRRLHDIECDEGGTAPLQPAGGQLCFG